MRRRPRLLVRCLLSVLSAIALIALPGTAEAQSAGKPGNGNGGGGKDKDSTAYILGLEIMGTADLQGDGAGGLTEYIDHRLPGGSTCVTGQRQNTKGKSFGARVHLDRGSDDSGDPLFNGCNNAIPLGDGDRRSFTMIIADQCACDELGAGAAPCTVSPDVTGAENGNPRVTADELFGSRPPDTSLVRIVWDVTDGSGNLLDSYSLQSRLPVFARSDFADGETATFVSDTSDPSHDFELGRAGQGALCTPFPVAIDVTFVLTEVAQ